VFEMKYAERLKISWCLEAQCLRLTVLISVCCWTQDAGDGVDATTELPVGWEKHEG